MKFIPNTPENVIRSDGKIGRRDLLVRAASLSVGVAASRALLNLSARAADGIAGPALTAGAARVMRVTLRPPDLSDDSLIALKQIGVDDVEVYTFDVPGYAESGQLDDAQLRPIQQRIEGHGMRIGTIILDQRALANLLLGKPDGERDLDKMSRTIECMGRASIPVLMYSLLVSRAILNTLGKPLPGMHRDPLGRGGAVLSNFDAARARTVTEEPAGRISAEEMWSRIERFARRCVPVADQAKVHLALHPDDPPVSPYWGVTQVLNSLDSFKRFLDFAPSPYNGLLFCQGTIQEAGIDLVEYVRTFGPAGKIAHAEFRGVRGNARRYEETFMDDGDVNLAPVVQALHETGYTGLLEVAHVPHLKRDPGERIVDAWSVGFLKGLIAAAAR